MNYINEALSKLDRMSKDKSYKRNPRAVNEACEGDECKETCDGEDCGAYSGKDRLDEWVTPGHCARWKRLETLADVEAWAEEVKKETGKEPKWYISNPAFGNREYIFKNYTQDGKVFIGGTHGVYGSDSEYFLGLAKPASKEGKSLCELELVSAYDINDKPLSTVLIGNGNGGKSIWPKDGDEESIQNFKKNLK